MADKIPAKRKQPVSQKRVAMVLASLVGMMTVTAAMLLVMEGGALGTAVPGWAVNQPTIRAMIEPPQPLRWQAWNFIIIYQSGDAAASAASLADGRNTGGNTSQGLRHKANFHFVINSAKSGRMDGELEVGTSWQNQVPGAPYAGWPDARSYSFTPYNNAVGICVSTDLHRRPDEAQHQTLLQLVHELQQRCPNAKILFQWELDDQARPTAEEKQYADSFRASL